MASSLGRRLALSFSLGTLAVAGAVGAYLDHALRESLDAEDELVMAAQAQALERRAAALGGAPETEGESRPEKAEWRVLDAAGRTLAESPGFRSLRDLPWPAEAPRPVEVETPQGAFTLMVAVQGGRRLQMGLDRTHEEALLWSFRRAVLGALAAAAAFAAAFGYLLARNGLAPLRRIAREAGSIDESHLDRRLQGGAFPLELRELVDTLNGALERLESAFHRLEALSTDLAHELRTPLQNLRADIEAWILRPADAPALPEALGQLLEELERLGSMVEQILFLARCEHPASQLRLRSLGAASLLQEVADRFEAVAEEGDVALRVEAPPELSLQGDATLLERALSNLVANALRHTPPGGEVRLSAELRPEGTALRVVDTGEGLPPDLVPRLGQRFVRSAARDRASGGTGLGLAIVKGIVLLHGGKWWVETDPGRETAFTLLIPPPEADGRA